MGKSDKPDPVAVAEERHATEMRELSDAHAETLEAIEAAHAEAIEAQRKQNVEDMEGQDKRHMEAMKKAGNTSSRPGTGVASGLEIREGDGEHVVQAVKAGRVAAEMIVEHRAGNLPQGEVRMRTLSVRVSRAVAIASQEIAPPPVREEGAQARTNEGLADMGQEEGAPHRISPKVPRRNKYKRETEAGRRRASRSVGKRARASDN